MAESRSDVPTSEDTRLHREQIRATRQRMKNCRPIFGEHRYNRSRGRVTSLEN